VKLEGATSHRCAASDGRAPSPLTGPRMIVGWRCGGFDKTLAHSSNLTISMARREGVEALREARLAIEQGAGSRGARSIRRLGFSNLLGSAEETR
jgi:hypothetical protein